MLFVLYGWLLFRAKSFDQIFAMTASLKNFTTPLWFSSYVINLIVFSLPLVVMEVYQSKRGGYRAPLQWSFWGRALLQGTLLLAIILFWEKEEVPFIYFQF